jgi:hypothetical protein
VGLTAAAALRPANRLVKQFVMLAPFGEKIRNARQQ